MRSDWDSGNRLNHPSRFTTLAPNVAGPGAGAKDLDKRSMSGEHLGERGSDVSTRLAGSASRIRRGIALAAGLAAAGGLALFATGADAGLVPPLRLSLPGLTVLPGARTWTQRSFPDTRAS